jgi:uncharacterized protein YndB with AHSA1/START domain
MTPPGPENPTTLVLRRTFPAARVRVFRAWIEPDALERWLKPRGQSMNVRELDARVGGSFRFELENGNSILGTYLIIVPPEKLSFTWSSGITEDRKTVVTVDFLDRGQTTEVILTHERLNAPEQWETASGGWAKLFQALESLLASTGVDA